MNEKPTQEAIIAIMTDFGEKDFYVGAMKGVILSINPNAKIVDISHNIEPFSVISGAYVLYGAYKYFPKGTTFLVVIDPGVGSSREPIVVRTDKYTFVAPNNGVLSLVLREECVIEKYLIPEDIYVEKPSYTFHGRDIFAPAAAYASLGSYDVFKEFKGDLIVLDITEYKVEKNSVRSHVINIDRFGNVALSVPYEAIRAYVSYGDTINVEGIGKLKFVRYFSELKVGETGLIVNSIGFLEICIREGNASEIHNLKLGDEVLLSW
ncbi:MAG: SAM-dependent chlorinase/fluorinase [Euryarchaeota archaeon]|nr:SAM-dependent chlorinase/fluorinase [Euryarchaeota archaeon]